MAKTMDDARRIGDGKSMGYDVLSGLDAEAGGLLLDKGSAKAFISSPSGGVEKIAVVLDDDGSAIDAITAVPFGWKFPVKARVMPDCRPIIMISDQAMRKTPYRAMVIGL